ncbi:unnamed protein product, partial [Nesidiocoris tenuis]
MHLSKQLSITGSDRDKLGWYSFTAHAWPTPGLISNLRPTITQELSSAAPTVYWLEQCLKINL